MNENKTILIVILILFLVIYLSAFTYFIVKYVVPSNSKLPDIKNNESKVIVKETSFEINSPQTEFFKKSVDHAKKVLTGNVYLDGYKYGAPLDLTKLDDNMKNSIIVSMNYMMIDPVSSRRIEQQFRLITDQENVSLWFVILHEAIKKLIPIENNPSVTQISNEALIAEIERRKVKQEEKENLENNYIGGKIVPINKIA